MQIVIQQPLYVNKIGKRAKNQDSLYPAPGLATAQNTVFLACDGVGGAASGEIASRISADVVGQFFENKKATIEQMEIAVNAAQTAIDAYLETAPLSKGMGTTLTFLQFNEEGATIAHIGDSRVYQMRDGNILFCTDDHSLVNEMRKKGITDLENVQSNIITRAIQGHSVRTTQADVTFLNDIKAGDYFFLCTDGVWGVFEDSELADIFKNTCSNETKLVQIEQRCAELSQDNYTAYLIQIETVIDNTATVKMMPSQNGISKLNGVSKHQKVAIEVTQKPRNAAWVMPFILVFTVLMVVLWFILNLKND